MDMAKLNSLGIKWASVEINGKEVFVERGRESEDFIPYYRWNSIVPLRKTSKVYLNNSKRQATNKELNAWLREDNPEHYRFSLNFKRTTGEYGNPFRFTVNSRFYDRYTQVLVLDRTRKFWIFASHDDWMYKGFILHAAMPAQGLSAEGAFTYLMAVYHLNRYEDILYDETQSHRSFEGDIVNCHSVNELPSDIQQEARKNAVEAYDRMGRQGLLNNDYLTPVPEPENGSSGIELIVKEDSWATSEELRNMYAEGKLHIACVADLSNPVLASGMFGNLDEEAIATKVKQVNINSGTRFLFLRGKVTIMPLSECSYTSNFSGRGQADWLRIVFKYNNHFIKSDTIYFNLRPDWSDSDTDYANARNFVYLIKEVDILQRNQ